MDKNTFYTINEVVSHAIRQRTPDKPLRKTVTKNYPNRGLDRPLGLQELEAPRISIQSVHEGGKVVSPTHLPPLPLSRP
jgi:hypothetical protein